MNIYPGGGPGAGGWVIFLVVGVVLVASFVALLTPRAKHLGEYRVRVKVADGREYTHVWPSGADSEEKQVKEILQSYTGGSFSCDCIRKIFLGIAAGIHKGLPSESYSCGNTIVLDTITLLCPDGTEEVIYDRSNEGNEMSEREVIT